MTTLEGNLEQDPRGGDGGQPGTAGAVLDAPRWRRTIEGLRRQPAAPETGRRGPRWRTAVQRGRGLVRRHPVFTVALVLAVALRLVAMLGFQPAILFRMDTFDYLAGARHLTPNVANTSGYSLFLWLLRPLQSLALVAALQHLMGLGIAILLYVLLRRYGLPGWGAALATVPVLFDPAQLVLEQMVMADVLAMTLLFGAVALLLLRERAPWWRLAIVGLLLGMSTIVRPTTLPLILLVPVYLLIRRAGWRRAVAALAGGALPVLAYMAWFNAAQGSFNLTNSNGLFLWTRTMSFANCAIIKPPPDLVPLCPQKQPPGLSAADPLKRPQPKYYLWNRRAWQWQHASPQLPPDAAPFTTANNARALRFAEKAILAQPLPYLHVVLHETSLPFRVTNALRFPVGFEHYEWPLAAGNWRYAVAGVTSYGASTATLPQILHGSYATALTQPFGSVMGDYQRFIYLPGPVLGLIVLAGLAGLVIPSRRSWPAAFVWVSAVLLMLVPTAEHDYTYRYVVPAIPLLCLAAALAFRRHRPAAERSGPPAEPPAAG